MGDAIRLAYVTCANQEEALRIGRALVEEKLAACVNLRPHLSIYRWDGALVQEEEYGLLAKTTEAAFPALQARVQALHSYSLPCILAWAPAAGLPPYLDWIRDNTDAPSH